jgi:ribosomal protein L37AE/L43A
MASKMTNFSLWVRQKMLEMHTEQQQTEQIYKQYRCPACWKVFVDRNNFGKMSCLNKDCGYTKELEALE